MYNIKSVVILAVALIIFASLLPNIYAGGPRLDYDERYKDIPGAPECWVDGYDAGFAGVYDKDRANECNNILGDQLTKSTFPVLSRLLR